MMPDTSTRVPDMCSSVGVHCLSPMPQHPSQRIFLSYHNIRWKNGARNTSTWVSDMCSSARVHCLGPMLQHPSLIWDLIRLLSWPSHKGPPGRSAWWECHHKSDLPKGVHSLLMGGLQHSRVAATLASPTHNEVNRRRPSESARWMDLAYDYSHMACLVSW